jgi:hypothetical protein
MKGRNRTAFGAAAFAGYAGGLQDAEKKPTHSAPGRALQRRLDGICNQRLSSGYPCRRFAHYKAK